MHNKHNLNLFVISGEVKFVLLSKSQKFFEYKINFNSKKKNLYTFTNLVCFHGSEQQ